MSFYLSPGTYRYDYQNVFKLTLTLQGVTYHVIGNPGNELVKARIEGEAHWKEYEPMYFNSERLNDLLDEDNYIPF